jgi:hypothetical protein
MENRVYHIIQNIFFTFKIVINKYFIDICSIRNFTDTCRIETFFRKKLYRCLYDSFLGPSICCVFQTIRLQLTNQLFNLLYLFTAIFARYLALVADGARSRSKRSAPQTQATAEEHRNKAPTTKRLHCPEYNQRATINEKNVAKHHI